MPPDCSILFWPVWPVVCVTAPCDTPTGIVRLRAVLLTRNYHAGDVLFIIGADDKGERTFRLTLFSQRSPPPPSYNLYILRCSMVAAPNRHSSGF